VGNQVGRGLPELPDQPVLPQVLPGNFQSVGKKTFERLFVSEGLQKIDLGK